MKSIKKYLNRESISYLIFGILTTIVSFVALYTFHDLLGINEIISNILSWVAAVTFAYITNKIFVFESTTHTIKELFREIIMFFGARLFSLGFETAGIAVAVAVKINLYIAKAFLSVVVVILNYIFSKLIIFNKTEDDKK